MAIGPFDTYAPPGEYTETKFDSPLQGALEALKIPVFIGEGNEYLVQTDFENVRGSSSSVDQWIPGEDATGRAVVSISDTGVITLGDFDGTRTQIQVRNFPVVSGNGNGTTSNDRSDVNVTIDGQPIVVLLLDGTRGLVTLSSAPTVDQAVVITYFFNRKDTLQTDDVSDQVADDQAIVEGLTGLGDVDAQNPTVPASVLDIHADVVNGSGVVVVPANNILLVTVDGVDYTLTIPTRNDYTMAQVATTITSLVAGTLTVSTFINNFGLSTLLFSADQDITIGAGSANSVLGIQTGQADLRVRTFYLFNGPIVDGSNGGVTTTDTADVTVKVDNVQVIPSSVDGTTRAVTLPFSPTASSTVTVQYWHNTWQDTFDYLNRTGVTSVDRCGEIPGGNAFIEESDFILKDDKILWGTAALVSSGVNTTGFTLFGETQVSSTLVDNRTFLSEAAAVVVSSGGVSSASTTTFQLAFEPTTGNGRDTPLGQSLFQSVSNGRIDLPTNRPDLVDAYWGYGVQDALDRGVVEVVKVEGVLVTLKDAVPVGATVYTSFYYNLLTDNEYTLTTVIPGMSGVGTYTVTDQGSLVVYNSDYDPGTKGTGLTGITLEFPSGSELKTDLHHEGGTGVTGPVAEVVTVQFETQPDSPAKFTSPGSSLYEFIETQSDRLRVSVDGGTVQFAAVSGGDLADPSTFGTGFFAEHTGGVIDYTGGTGATVGTDYTLATDEVVNLLIDGVQVATTVEAATAVDALHFVGRVNEAASGTSLTLGTIGTATTLVMPAGFHPNDDYYNGWVVVGGTVALGTVVKGEAQTVTDYDGATGTLTIAAPGFGGGGTAPGVGDVFFLYNPATMAVFKGATLFNGPVIIGAGTHDDLVFIYQGDVTGATAATTVTIPATTYATAATLATALETAINAAVPVGQVGLVFTVDADADGRIQFKMQLPGDDSVGFLTFIGAATTADDFAVLAGLETGTAVGDGQPHMLQGPIVSARQRVVGGANPYDRVVLRNRILPGQLDGTVTASSIAPNNAVEQMSVEVQAGSGNAKMGLTTGAIATGADKAVVHPATQVGRVGFAEGVDAAAEPLVTFYDGTGVPAANNVLSFTVDGVPVTVTFTGTGAGTATPLGPNSAGSSGSILDQILDAVANATLVPGEEFGATAAAVLATGLILQEGAGIRITSQDSSVASAVVIGAGNANSALGFTDGEIATRTLVGADVLVSALMSNRDSSFADYILLYPSYLTGTWSPAGGATANHFADLGVALVATDATGNEYLCVQSLIAGTASSVLFQNTTVGQDALFPGTGLNIVSGSGETGEAGLNGYFVISNTPSGTGSANTSTLNNGVGEDGVVGQTYRDSVTGLTFTVLPRGFNQNPTGPWLAYPTGGTATYRINVSSTFTTDANIPHNSLGGVDLMVSNTSGVGVGDTAIVETFERGGQEPSIGDVYYTTFTYRKQDFTTSFFTRMANIEASYGETGPDSPLSLASYFAILNGAVVVGLKQVPRATGSNYASLDDYVAAVQELESPLVGNTVPDIITPLRGDSLELYQVLKRSNGIMSSIRYKSERTTIFGLSAGSVPRTATDWAQTLGDTRMRMVYPDMVTVSLQNALGETKESLIDGPMIAAGLVGSVVSANVDVATPWTNRRLVGYTSLARRLDAVEQNQIAQKGVTIIDEALPFLRVRHGLTTDVTNVLTRTPTITMIADEVQRQSRVALERFIGIKFMPTVLSQIEGRLSTVLKALVKKNIIATYVGIEARVHPKDPTTADVTAYYQPVFPLLYILMTFHMRSSIT